MIDLHSHSFESDGTDTPEKLLQIAADKNVSALALTDHDTTAGLQAFLKAAENLPVQAIPGIELACSWYGSSLHLVGLYIEPEADNLERMLSFVREARNTRNDKIIAKLVANGVDINVDELLKEADGEVMGRVHMARIIMNKGYVSSVNEAFEKYLSIRGTCYEPRYLPMPSEAIHAIHKAGGVAVWAHPLGLSDLPRNRFRNIIKRFMSYGLDGIEIHYPDYTEKHNKLAKEMQEQFKLLPAGGSDFHGSNRPGVEIGTGKNNNIMVPDEYLEPIYQKACEYKKEFI